MNQGISQALSMLMYTLGAVTLFAVAVAVFGGGYYYSDSYGAAMPNTVLDADKNMKQEYIDKDYVKVNSVWDKLGSTMKR